MNITSYPDRSTVIEGTPEEILLYNKLYEEWDLLYGELKARGLSLIDIISRRDGSHADDLLNILTRGGKEDETK